MPPMAASDPGQNIVAARLPCRIAVTQIGSPPHQRASFAVSADMRETSPGIAGSTHGVGDDAVVLRVRGR